MKTRRDQIVSQLHQLQSEVNVVMNFLGDDKVMKTMETMRDPKTLSTYLTKEFNVSVLYYFRIIWTFNIISPARKISLTTSFTI